MKEKGRAKPTRFADVELLQRRIAEESPKQGEYFYDYKLEEAEREMTLLDQQEFHRKYKINFADLPLSAGTLKGLASRGFTKMTEVQRCAIPHALAGRDLLVSSRTGSGKTLAYLVPLIEKLYRQRFIPLDGLGAVVVVPVRELAMQVFQVLNSFSEKLEMSVGLVIGGKDVKYERDRIAGMNILICTPGRLLQHLEETYGFETNNMKMLVLDEADVMLEMGFREPLKAILEYLPRAQTLLFSATMTRDIYALANICTHEPEKILLQGVSARQAEEAKEGKESQVENGRGRYQTPAKLTQYYMVVQAEQKINTFYSFLKTHHKQKIVVFVSTCKQVRFLYEALRKFKLGSPLYELQGHQKQKKRMAIYFTFCEKRYGVLLCTNIAARGLDFPLVDWVIQIDIPDQPDTYVHRVGRTARYKSEGRALLFVSQHERPFVDELQRKGMILHKISQNPQRYLRIQSSLQSICSEHQDVKYLAQRAIISYIRFLYKAPNKHLFDISKINLELLAKSYGLLSAPQIAIKQNQSKQSQEEEGEEGEEKQPKPKLSKIEQLRLKQKLKKMEKKQANETKQESQPEEEQEEEQEQQEDQDNFLKIKGKVTSQGERAPLSVSKRQLKKIKPEGHFEGKNKTYFDSTGNPLTADEYRKQSRLKANRDQVEYNPIDTIQSRIEKNRQADDNVEKQRRKVQRRKRESARELSRHPQRQQAVLASASQDEQ